MAAEATQMAKVCAEKRRLLATYEDAVREVMALQSEHIAALADSGEGLQTFDVAISQAREKKEHPKELYQLHIRTHGC